MIELREATFSDHAAIAKLHAVSWQQHYRSIFSDHFLDNEVAQFLFDGWYKKLVIANGHKYVTIAVLEETIVGFACLLLNDHPVFGSLLDNLHVSMKLQKSGIGKLLMKNCAQTICDKAANRKMYLWVYALNNNARLAYGRKGGTLFETTEIENADGTRSLAFRYVWNDVAVMLQTSPGDFH